MKKVFFTLLLMMSSTIAAYAGYATVQRAVFDVPVGGEFAAETSTGLPLIDDFNDDGVYNNVGFQTGTFALAGSDASCIASNAAGAGSDGSVALRLRYNVTDTNSYSGYYTQLGGVSFTPYGILSFKVKGAVGNEYFKIQLATQTGTYRYASVMITDALDGNVTTSWQEVRIPLLQFFNLTDISSMKELVFVFENAQSRLNGLTGSQLQGTIYIDDIKVIPAGIPDELMIDDFTDKLGTDALGGNIASFASSGSSADASFVIPGAMTSHYTIAYNGWAGHSFILGGGAGLVGEETGGWQPVERPELMNYTGLRIRLQPQPGTPKVKVEIKVRLKNLESLGWISAFNYINPALADQTIPFQNMQCYVYGVLTYINDFKNQVDAINGEAVITYEFSSTTPEGNLVIDSFSFVK